MEVSREGKAEQAAGRRMGQDKYRKDVQRRLSTGIHVLSGYYD